MTLREYVRPPNTAPPTDSVIIKAWEHSKGPFVSILYNDEHHSFKHVIDVVRMKSDCKLSSLTWYVYSALKASDCCRRRAKARRVRGYGGAQHYHSASVHRAVHPNFKGPLADRAQVVGCSGHQRLPREPTATLV